MTKQQAFNKIWKTFVTNQLPQCTGRVGCSYGSPGQVGCAVGCLLHKKDKEKAYEWEKKTDDSSFSKLKLAFPEIQDYLPVGGVFLKRMQTWHDREMDDDIQERKEQLRKIAKAYKLTAPAK